MTEKSQKTAAKIFVEKWAGRGREDEDGHSFWIELMQTVLGVDNPTQYMTFEKKVKIKGGSTKRIDVYIPGAKVMIEQKSIGVNLDKPQPGHDNQTPFEQAKFYNDNLNYDERVRWIIVSNFKETRIYDMNDVLSDPIVTVLEELPEKLSAFEILKTEMSEQIRFEEKISKRAGDITAALYDALIKQYADPGDEEILRSLNQLCVRLVFCLYAEDAGIFSDNQFHDYIAQFQPQHIRKALIELFKILDTPTDKRDPDEEKSLLDFPYANGGLFKDETIRIPQFNDEIKDLLLNEASAGIDWSDISPTIFGSIFESTLNPETRRSGGMHYTSVENIHKVIDPLFLNDLNNEFEQIREGRQANVRERNLREFQKKLASLTFLDPACGSGNFLTETYLSLRRLENRILSELSGGQIMLGDSNVNPIQVSISQFYGIEINDFAVTVAKTALWIAESQMMRETEEIVRTSLNVLPLKTNATIIEGNALQIDWENVVSKDRLNFIMGNPPFVGYSLQSAEQKQDILAIYTDENGKPYKTAGKIDYVSGWYFKAAQLIDKTNIKVAFVSTNSITQGEQVSAVWKPLYDRFGIHIDFAHRTFKWDSESKSSAQVHCVIVGFNTIEKAEKKILFSLDGSQIVENISPYLVNSENVFIESRKKPICDVPIMNKGSIPVDDGNFLLNDEEYKNLICEEPKSKKWIKTFLGAREFLHNEKRYCLWLLYISPSELKSMPKVLEKVKKVKEFRLQSTKEATRKYADYPTRFMEIRQPKNNYILFPSHSSENRKYIPIGFMSPDIICSNANFIIENAALYQFGILNSSIHMAWTRAVCGRIKSDYRYSNDIVYNNFPWCDPTDEQKTNIEETAQGILDARAKFTDCSLADLYDENTMPTELRKAHQANDKAVMAAYGFPQKMSEGEIVAELMKMYKQLTENND
ncbi:MAG: methylase [Firmicutes bacterium]|nr:methylase [[Eubacterium] siraeum]MCM1486996.1 methylase [Bacillota bacterium]